MELAQSTVGFRHITVVTAASSTGPNDVASGYIDAFRRIGIRTNVIEYNSYVTRWHETLRYRALFEGNEINNELKIKALERASGEVALVSLAEFPDLIVVIDGTQIHRRAWNVWRRLNIPTVLIMTECPYRDNLLAHVSTVADYPFSNDLASARKMGVPYQPTGWHQEVHHPMIVSNKYKSDVCFIGSGWPERIKLLEGVDWEGIDLTLIGHYPFDYDHPLAEHYKAAMVPNPEAAMHYNGAKIVLNFNRQSVDYKGGEKVTEAESISPRVYEIAACGAFMLSEDGRPELETVFGDLVPTFSTDKELNELIHYWLPKEEERIERGRMLRKAVESHSYLDRAISLLERI
jgi:spore maturation protein CgeB